jgi:hypothetical protein
MRPVSSSAPSPEPAGPDRPAAATRPQALPAPSGMRGPERVDRWLRTHPRQADLGLALLLGLPLGALSVSSVDRERWGWAAVQIACAVLVPVALVARRAAPALSFGAVSVLLAGSELVPALRPDTPFLPAAALFPVALYSYCAYGGRRAAPGPCSSAGEGWPRPPRPSGGRPTRCSAGC